MNPLVLFLPSYRASTTAYLLGLLLLALLDFARVSAGLSFFLNVTAMAAIFFFVFSLHANRRRYVDRGIGLGALPPSIGLIGAVIGALVGMTGGVMSTMTEFAAENGVDTTDQEAFTAAVSEPGFQAAYQTWLEGNEAALSTIAAGLTVPAFMGFWLVVAGFAVWFAQMQRNTGTGIQQPPS